MRRLVVSFHTTVNNIVTGPPSGDETDFVAWAQPGVDESSAAFLGWLDDVDTVILGRGTYDDLVRKWPTVQDWPDASDVTLRMGAAVNGARKFVITHEQGLDTLPWGDHEPATVLGGDDVARRIGELKAEAGNTMITFGSPALVHTLVDADLVDEFRLLVHPVLVHEGRSALDGLDHRTDLRLIDVHALPSGTLMLRYAVDRAS